MVIAIDAIASNATETTKNLAAIASMEERTKYSGVVT